MDEKRHTDIKNAGIKSRHAMAWLRDHKLPADPVCYTLAYEYLHCNNNQLKQRLDHFDMDHVDSLAQLHEIYEQCIIAQKYQDLSSANKNVNQYVSEILQLLIKSQNNIKDFKPILKSIQDQIEHDSPASTTAKACSAAQQSEQTTTQSELELEGSADDYLAVKPVAEHDQETGLLTASGLQQVLTVCSQYAENFPIALIKFDLDQLRLFADNHGTFMAGGVIKHTANTLKNHIKGSDFIAHTDDDEFIIMMPRSPAKEIVSVADKLRKIIAGLTLKKKNTDIHLKFTCSLGVSEMTITKPFNCAIQKANIALNRSKDLGRNCVNVEL